MKTSPFENQFRFERLPEETREYVYQVLAELEPFAIEETTITVLTKDPKLLSLDETSEHFGSSEKVLSNLKRIGIVMQTEGVEIEGEGLHTNWIDALRSAKENLLKKLFQMQDDMISKADRQAEINSFQRGSNLIH